jgi:hypothetical protein
VANLAQVSPAIDREFVSTFVDHATFCASDRLGSGLKLSGERVPGSQTSTSRCKGEVPSMTVAENVSEGK